jgi:23S rRNA (adenine1618-N6)-methyltransferase
MFVFEINNICSWAYIRWIQNLLDSTTGKFTEGYGVEQDVIGLDVGVGASCIYALLGCTARPKWRFYGTEIDQKSYEYALHNVVSNDLESRIQLLKSSELHALLPLDALQMKVADFTMCNPPFFESKQDMMGLFEKKKKPSAVCTGSEVEMITEGGEAEYVSRMVVESQALAKRVRWYTSQLGKLATLSVIVAKLKELECHNWAVGVLMPNATTRRWVIGWSWNDLRPANHVARPSEHGPAKELLPYPTSFYVDTTDQVQSEMGKLIDKVLVELPLLWNWDSSARSGIGHTREDVWSRAARRKRKRQEMEVESKSECGNSMDDIANVNLAFRVVACEGHVEIQWLKGADLVLWESFCAMMKRQLAPSGKQVPSNCGG